MNLNVEHMSPAQKYLLRQGLHLLDSLYDPAMRMIGNESNKENAEEQHSTRSSAHYALGLLIRDEPGDVERAIHIIDAVLDMQFVDEREIYYGTFRTSPQAITPPIGNYNWKTLGEGHAFFLADTFEKIIAQWLQTDEYTNATDEERKVVSKKMTSVIEQVIPPVWHSYDPNWREFIGSTFAIILELYECKLPTTLVERIDHAMVMTVTGSIDRRLSDAIPMNTNIELMHLFISDYFAHRYQNKAWIDHTKREVSLFLDEYREFGTFAEFNSTTYYGVDLTVLGMIRKYSKLEVMKQFGQEVEAQLWRTIALYYNANLENLAGPYSRAYEMDMITHSSMGVFLYLALGEDYKHLARENCESSHNPLITLVGVSIPDDLLPVFQEHKQDRLVIKQFRELCERHAPDNKRHLCEATTWIEKNMMLGALSGSQNTSGQLHPATIHWKNNNGEKYYFRLQRREVGGHWSTHLRGIIINSSVDSNEMSISVDLSADRNIEVLFQMIGPNIERSEYKDGVWQLPGLSLSIEDEGLLSTHNKMNDQIEQVYRYEYIKGAQTMNFKLNANLS